ncbi:MAG: TIGR01620 family protein [Rhodobacteraceae bacterium]|nr:TIGR01620 family protein [Paracoccaceae bacterium]
MSDDNGPSGPILIDLEPSNTADPAAAPPVPDIDPLEHPAAMQRVAAIAARRQSSRLAQWFWTLLLGLFTFWLSLAAWSWVERLLARSPILGLIGSILLGGFVIVLLVLALRELTAYWRLEQLDRVQKQAVAARSDGDLDGARAVEKALMRLYAKREDVAWGLSRLKERSADVLDAATLLDLTEATLLGPLDARAEREVEAAARQVATVTAIVPLPLADIVAALAANLRMIRRIAEIYGGRAGTVGAWRLTRTVLTHLVATGAVAVGDDLISSVAGGTLLSKISRRFGEGVVNGALTARVGIAAIEVCRPLPFSAQPRPAITALIRRALAGLFGRASEP